MFSFLIISPSENSIILDVMPPDPCIAQMERAKVALLPDAVIELLKYGAWSLRMPQNASEISETWQGRQLMQIMRWSILESFWNVNTYGLWLVVWRSDPWKPSSCWGQIFLGWLNVFGMEVRGRKGSMLLRIFPTVDLRLHVSQVASSHFAGHAWKLSVGEREVQHVASSIMLAPCNFRVQPLAWPCTGRF